MRNRLSIVIDGYLRGVVSEPVVRLAEVVKDDVVSVAATRREDDGRTGVRLRRHPGTVERVGDEERRQQEHHPCRHLPDDARTVHATQVAQPAFYYIGDLRFTALQQHYHSAKNNNKNNNNNTKTIIQII